MTARTDSRAKRPGRKALNDQLLTDLRGLQDDLRTMVERYEVRVGGVLNDVIRRIEGDASIEQKARPATIRAARAMLAELEAAKIKPRKARAKDLARLEKLARSLRDLSG